MFRSGNLNCENNLKNYRTPLIKLSIVMLAITSLAHAQAPSAAADRTKILDLVFRVDDMGGKVQSLAVKETPTEVRIDLAADVLFDSIRRISCPSATTLSQAADIIRAKAKGKVRIDGYTDAKGTDAHNQPLSERALRAVETWFKTKEISRTFRLSRRDSGEGTPLRRTPTRWIG